MESICKIYAFGYGDLVDGLFVLTSEVVASTRLAQDFCYFHKITFCLTFELLTKHNLTCSVETSIYVKIVCNKTVE